MDGHRHARSATCRRAGTSSRARSRPSSPGDGGPFVGEARRDRRDGAAVEPRAGRPLGLRGSATGAVIAESVLLDGCRIGAGARGARRDPRRRGRGRRAGATIEAGSVIGAGARVEAGATVAPGSRDPARRGWSRRWRRERAWTRSASVDPSGQLDDVLALPDHLRDALWRVESAGLEPEQAQRADRLRDGRLGDRRGARASGDGRRAGPADADLSRLRAAARGRRPIAPCSARATRATPRRRSPASRPPRRSARAATRRPPAARSPRRRAAPASR